jgi:hypothetical protein
MDLKDLFVLIAGFMWLPLSVITGLVANKRGRFGYSWFLLSVVVTPVVTGPLLLALPRQSGGATVLAKDADPQSPIHMDQVEIMAPPKLRFIFIIMAAAMLALWGLSLIAPIENWGNPNEDGFSYAPAFWATIICLPVGLNLLAGAITGRGRHVARARNALFIGGGALLIVVAPAYCQFDGRLRIGLSVCAPPKRTSPNSARMTRNGSLATHAASIIRHTMSQIA